MHLLPKLPWLQLSRLSLSGNSLSSSTTILNEQSRSCPLKRNVLLQFHRSIPRCSLIQETYTAAKLFLTRLTGQTVAALADVGQMHATDD